MKASSFCYPRAHALCFPQLFHSTGQKAGEALRAGALFSPAFQAICAGGELMLRRLLPVHGVNVPGRSRSVIAHTQNPFFCGLPDQLRAPCPAQPLRGTRGKLALGVNGLVQREHPHRRGSQLRRGCACFLLSPHPGFCQASFQKKAQASPLRKAGSFTELE